MVVQHVQPNHGIDTAMRYCYVVGDRVICHVGIGVGADGT
jgi:hypothetical protein